jgi:hydroxyacylglutathione hydrolase
MPQALIVEAHQVGPLENNTYLILDREGPDAVLVDPGMGCEFLADEIQKRGIRLTAILNTHGHFDHVYNNGLFSERFGCPIMLHEGDLDLLREMPQHAALFGFSAKPSPEPASFLADGAEIQVGGGRLRAVHTPGHSPGGICFTADGFVICGDTLFAQSIGRTDLPGGDYDTLVASIRAALYSLPDSTEVLPGHGPSTLIGFEKRHNPFVKAQYIPEVRP